jgi:nucleoside phosphorylase/tetratricopeptide (TPR) repeat protein
MSQGTAQRVDVVIVTAIALEYEAVLKVDAGAVPGSVWREDKQENGVAMAYRAFEVPKGRPLQVAVAVAPGMATAAALTTLIPLIEKLEPSCIAMCGVCAGRPGKVQLGDVVAAERLYYHDTGKQSREEGKPERLQQDLRTFNLRPAWKSALDQLAEGNKVAERFKGQDWLAARPLSNEWRERRALLAIHEGALEPWNNVEPGLKQSEWPKVVAALRKREWLATDGPDLTDAGRKAAVNLRFEYPGTPDLSPHGTLWPFRLHVAPMATGNKVIEDEQIWDRLAASERKTLGLDMEAAALGAAAHYLHDKKLDAIVMKGVMDFANAGRDDHFKEFAARASAECLLWFLRHHLETGESTGYDTILSPGVLPLPPGEVPPSKLLQARYGVVPWHDAGRAALLTELDAWADDASLPVAAWLLHAEGGAGKSRLAIEWVQRRRNRYDIAGFLDPSLKAQWLERLTSQGPPVIIVIDYAESRSELAALLCEVAKLDASADPPVRVRVLLLARSDGDWWAGLVKQHPELEPLFTSKKPRQLAPLASTTADRQIVWNEAVNAFAAYLGIAVAAVASTPLEDVLFSRALYLHMSALLAVERARQPATDDPSAVPVAPISAGSLLEDVLDHEERYWVSKSAQRGIVAAVCALARQVVAAATLRGGFKTQSEAGAVLACFAQRQRTAEDDQLLQLLGEIYQRGQLDQFLPGLEPDLLGEGMVARLARLPVRSGVDAQWIERAAAADGDPHAMTMAFTVLGRASIEDPEIARRWISQLLLPEKLAQRAVFALRAAKAVGTRTAYAVVGDVLAEELERAGSSAVARALDEEGIPRPSVSLVRVAEWQSRTMLRDAQVAVDQLESGALAIKACRLIRHGNDLDALGQRAEALAAAEEAVTLYRVLSAPDPEAFRRDLARSLNGLGIRLRESRQDERAVAASQGAVDLLRPLATENPEAFGADFAISLQTLGTASIGLGQHAKALAAIEEAVDILRTLAAQNPDTFLLLLANSLSNLGGASSGLGQHAKALAAIEEAVDILRTLAAQNPDTFLPRLANSLRNLGNALSKVRQLEPALVAMEESVRHYQALAVHAPDTFRPDLAGTLNVLGTVSSQLGQHERALAATQEAFTLYCALAEENRFKPDLAMILNNLGVMFSKVGCRELALAATERSVTLYRALYSETQDAYRSGLADSLNNLGNRLGEVGLREPALAATEQSVTLYRALYSETPDAYRSGLAKSLNNLGIILHQLECGPEGDDAKREAEDLDNHVAELQQP